MGAPAKNRKYRLFAVDVDGTLQVPGEPVPPQLIEGLKECLRNGIQVVIATGKNFRSIKGLCEAIGLVGPVVTCNGGMIVKADTGKVLFSKFVPVSCYRQVVQELEDDYRVSIAVFTDEDLVCTGINPASLSLAAIGETTTRFVRSLSILCRENVVKILVHVANTETLRAVYNDYSQRWGDTLSITVTSDKFVEFMAPGVSKGNAIRYIASKAEIDSSCVACIGDSDNDLSMFAVSSLRIAVANATSDVLDAADVIVPSVRESGLWEAIRSLLLGNGK